MTKDKVRCRVKALHGIAERVLASGSFLPTAVYLQINYVSNFQFWAFTSCFSFLIWKWQLLWEGSGKIMKSTKMVLIVQNGTEGQDTSVKLEKCIYQRSPIWRVKIKNFRVGIWPEVSELTVSSSYLTSVDIVLELNKVLKS